MIKFNHNGAITGFMTLISWITQMREQMDVIYVQSPADNEFVDPFQVAKCCVQKEPATNDRKQEIHPTHFEPANSWMGSTMVEPASCVGLKKHYFST